MDIFDNVIGIEGERKGTNRDVDNYEIENCVNQHEIKEGEK